MIPELGLIAFISGLAFSFLLSIIPFIGIYSKQRLFINYAVPLSYGSCFFITTSALLLIYSFCQNDFSVIYIAQHSNSQLPFIYKITALWGGHEGSMLFGLLCLSIWTALVAKNQQKIDPFISAAVLAILGIIITILGIFILFWSSPFERIFPAPLDGRDLNPMLQDIGFVFHPPLLYLGYVGFAVNFAFAIAALLIGQMDAAIAKWSRPWAITSWLFLTTGIGLGAWWAYYELGWGGWWFWDPVENASLMPWLLGCALLHALLATERRAILKNTSLLLSIFTFIFSLLGTFIVRSGILNSVHAFAVDPERGNILLVLLVIITFLALVLFALRANIGSFFVKFDFLSKEMMLILAIALFCVATVIVLLGTFYPLFFNLLGLGSLSVGAPYFNSTFIFPVLVSLFFIGLVFHFNWKYSPEKQLRFLVIPLLLSLVGGVAITFWFEQWSWVVVSTVTFSLWLLLSGLVSLVPFSFKQCCFFLVHAGIAITAIGTVLSGYYTKEKSVLMAQGMHSVIAGYTVKYKKTDLLIDKNYTAEQITLDIYNHQGQQIAQLKPQLRHYTVRSMIMSEPGIQWGFLGDFYAVVGKKTESNGYPIRIYYKPFIRWIEFGVIMSIFGGILIVLRRWFTYLGDR